MKAWGTRVVVVVAPGVALPASAQDIPRLSDGRPDLNGIWQVLSEANYDLAPHMAVTRCSCARGRSDRCRPHRPCDLARSARCRAAWVSSSAVYQAMVN